MIKTLNTATCPKCQSKDTKRGGYEQDKGGSMWRCQDADCRHIFYVKTLVFLPQ